MFKDHSIPPAHITLIPMESLEHIKDWLDSMDVVYGETSVNLLWSNILKVINEDPVGFYRDGGWATVVTVQDEEFVDSEEESEQESEFEAESDAEEVRVTHRWQNSNCCYHFSHPRFHRVPRTTPSFLRPSPTSLRSTMMIQTRAERTGTSWKRRRKEPKPAERASGNKVEIHADKSALELKLSVC